MTLNHHPSIYTTCYWQPSTWLEKGSCSFLWSINPSESSETMNLEPFPKGPSARFRLHNPHKGSLYLPMMIHFSAMFARSLKEYRCIFLAIAEPKVESSNTSTVRPIVTEMRHASEIWQVVCGTSLPLWHHSETIWFSSQETELHRRGGSFGERSSTTNVLLSYP